MRLKGTTSPFSTSPVVFTCTHLHACAHTHVSICMRTHVHTQLFSYGCVFVQALETFTWKSIFFISPKGQSVSQKNVDLINNGYVEKIKGHLSSSRLLQAAELGEQDTKRVPQMLFCAFLAFNFPRASCGGLSHKSNLGKVKAPLGRVTALETEDQTEHKYSHSFQVG